MNKISKADEMFEKLGYKKILCEYGYAYEKVIDNKHKYIAFTGNNVRVFDYKVEDGITISDRDNYTTINNEVIKAINQKILEEEGQ